MSDSIKNSGTTRRGFIKSSGSALAGVGLALTSKSLMAQDSDKYGIQGQPAPEIKLDYWIDGSGEQTTFSVAEAKGKWVFLKFFQNWCPGCHSSGFPTLKEFSDEFYGHPKVEIAAVQTVFEGYGTNTQDAVRELQIKYDIPAVMGHDPGDKESHLPALTMINYRTGGTPWLVLIDPEGVVAFNNFHVDREKLIDFVAEQIA